ncbi:MAG: AAA family ATPase, partial [Gammaproteobacteria bacterium]
MATTPPDAAPIVERAVDLAALLTQKSYFLFGPRQTGKTTWVRHGLPHARVYDLLDSTMYLALSHRPARLAEEVGPEDRIVVLDEIQRLPVLLNEVHRLIEERGVRFLLTGSSARKLRRGGVNLLGGRARTLHWHPLTSHALG